MAYNKHSWISRLGTLLNRFRKESETSTHVVLVNEPESITEPGTSINVGWLNEMEEGIFQAHVTADGNTSSISTINGQITTIQEDISFSVNDVSINSASWVDNTGTLGFWTFDITDSRITASAVGIVGFDKADRVNVVSDGILQQNDTLAGILRIYATQQPTNNYTVDILVGGQ